MSCYQIKSLLFVPFFLWYTFAFSNVDIVFSVNKGKVHSEYVSTWPALELGNKVNIFVALADKLINEKFPNSEQVYVYIGHNYPRADTSFYALGYGQFSLPDFTNQRSKDVKCTGIKLVVKCTDFDIRKSLLLVHAALRNVENIKRNQLQVIVKPNDYDADTLLSISRSAVKNILSSADSVIDKFLNDRYYRYLKKRPESGEIDYYYQNNKFYVYHTGKPRGEWSSSQGKFVVTDTFNNEILAINNIEEIAGSVSDGHFIFINDSDFYFVSSWKDSVLGPFKIGGIGHGRPPISKYYHEYRPVEKFILFVGEFSQDNKVLFVPDSNLVVSNYGQLENEFINGFFKKKTVNNVLHKSDKTIIILSVLLGLSALLILFLITRPFKRLF